MADASLNIKMVANTTELKSGLAEATKAAEQFSAKGKQLVQAGASMGNGLKQIGTAASGLKGKLGGFTSELANFTDEIAAGVGPVDALASRIPLLLRSIGGLNPVMRLATTAISAVGGGLITMGIQALTATEKVRSLKDVGGDIKSSFGDWKAAAADLERSFQQLGNTTNATALQIRRGFVNEMNLSRQQILNGFKELPVALGNEMSKFKGTFDPVVNMMKDLSPWVQKTLVGFRTLGGAMQATTPQAQGLVNTLQGLKSLGASQQQLDAIAIGINNVNVAAKSKDPQAYAAALQDAANRLSELLQVLGVAPGEIQRLVGQFYAGAESARAMAGQVSVLTQSLIDLVKARNALSQSAGASLGGFAGGNIDQLTRKYTDYSTQLKQMRTDTEAFWTAAKSGADAAAKATLNGYIPAQDKVKAKLGEVKQAYATLGTNATAEDTRNYSNAVAELNGQLSKLASGGGGGGGGGGGSLGRAASGSKATGDAAKKAADQMNQAKAKVSEFGEAMQSIAQSLGSGVVDALFSIAEGSQSAKEAFSALAKSMLKQIAQLVMELLVLKPLMAMFGGGLGVLSGGAGAVGMASQSLVSSMSVGRSGNIGSYAGFGPSPSVMQTMRSNVGSLPSTVAAAPMTVNVHNNVGANVRTEQDGRTLQIFLEAAEEMVADRITRGGNRIDQSMQRAFGARRIGY